PFDGKPELFIAVGPAYVGTAIRDAAGFIHFSQFTNQLDYADVATALNNRVRDTVVQDAVVSSAVSRSITFDGACELVDPKRILVDGAEVHPATPRDAARRGIGIIHHELSLFPNLSIAENVFAGREPTRRAHIVDRRRERAEAGRLLERLEQRLNVDVLVGEL